MTSSNTTVSKDEEEQDKQMVTSTYVKLVIYLILAFVIVLVIAGVFHICGKLYTKTSEIMNDNIIEPLKQNSKVIKSDKFWPFVFSIIIIFIFIIIKSGVAST